MKCGMCWDAVDFGIQCTQLICGYVMRYELRTVLEYYILNLDLLFAMPVFEMFKMLPTMMAARDLHQ